MQLGLWYSPGRKRANLPSPSSPLDSSGPAANPQSAVSSKGPVASARVVQAQAEKLRFLIETLVKSSRLDSGILVLTPALHPVAPLLEEAAAQVNSRPHPLALYLFTRSRAVEKMFEEYVSFGGGCINDTIMHLSVPSLGFGGVGRSGMGSYHGRKSFETFSHEKSILKKPFWLDMPLRYQPYTNKLYQKMIRIFLR